MSDLSARFPKSRRLLNSAQYKTVLRQGKRLFNPLFMLAIMPNHQTQTRLGITVSKKVSQRAVDRNRIKRQMREFFRLNDAPGPHFDVVMVAHPEASMKTNRQIRQALDKLWRKAGRYINR